MELLAFVAAVAGSVSLGLLVTHVLLTLLITAMVRSTVAFDDMVVASFQPTFTPEAAVAIARRAR